MIKAPQSVAPNIARPCAWAVQWLGNPSEAVGWRAHDVPMDGSCLFHTLSKIMTERNGGDMMSASFLRKAVAESILVSSPSANNALIVWYEMYKVNPFNSEVAHMTSAFKYDDPLSEEARKAACSLMKTRVYFGDEYALGVLEKILNVKIIVVGKKDDAFVRLERTTNNETQYPHVCYIKLENIHYEPISYRSKFLFSSTKPPH